MALTVSIYVFCVQVCFGEELFIIISGSQQSLKLYVNENNFQTFFQLKTDIQASRPARPQY